MAVRIRLTRMGKKKKPFYRLVVADSRTRRDGRYIELLGTYNPLRDPAEIKVDRDKALEWLRKGATPSDTAKGILKMVGVWEMFEAEKKGKVANEGTGGVSDRENSEVSG